MPGTHTTLLAHKQADPVLIYRVVKTIIDHGKEFGELHPGGREFTVEKTRSLSRGSSFRSLSTQVPSATGGKRVC